MTRIVLCGIIQGMDKFDVILADPPWRYGKTIGQGVAEDQYPTMGIEEICAVPVWEVSADNCVLFLWTTPPHYV